MLTAERIAAKDLVAEDIGVLVSRLLCDEIAQGGCIDSAHQSLAILLMAFCPEDVSTLRVGKLAPHA